MSDLSPPPSPPATLNSDQNQSVSARRQIQSSLCEGESSAVWPGFSLTLRPLELQIVVCVQIYSRFVKFVQIWIRNLQPMYIWKGS